MVPKISITGSPNTSTVLDGTNVNFTCTANAAPKPTLSWSRVNKNFTAISSIKTADRRSILMLTNVTNDEEGIYTCSAQNRGPPVERHVNLTVHGTVSTLYIVKFSDVLERSAVVLLIYFPFSKDSNETSSA